MFKEQKMFSGDCYHTEIKIYLKLRKKLAESNKILQTKPSKAVHVLKAGVLIIHGSHPKVKSTH